MRSVGTEDEDAAVRGVGDGVVVALIAPPGIEVEVAV